MKFSEARQSYLAHAILRLLREEGLAEVEQERHVLAEIKRALVADESFESMIDERVRRRIASLSRKVEPGSREWEVLYRQYYEQEVRKAGRK